MGQIFLIRHAQASYGKPVYDQLSDMGYEQSRLLGEYFFKNETHFDKIYMGPLIRHRQTFETVEAVYDKQGVELPAPEILEEADEHQGPQVLKKLLPQLVEIDPKIKKWETERQADPSLYRKNGLKIFDHTMNLWAGGALDDIHPTEYQKFSTFRATVKRGMQQLLKSEKGQNIAVFTSGGTKAAAIGHILELDVPQKVIELNVIIRNTSVSKIMYSADRASLLEFNNTAHLPAHMKTYV